MSGVVGTRVLVTATADSPAAVAGTVTGVSVWDDGDNGNPVWVMVKWDDDPGGPRREAFDELTAIGRDAALQAAVKSAQNTASLAAARLSLLLASDDFVASLVLGGRRFGFSWGDAVRDITAARDALDQLTGDAE